MIKLFTLEFQKKINKGKFEGIFLLNEINQQVSEISRVLKFIKRGEIIDALPNFSFSCELTNARELKFQTKKEILEALNTLFTLNEERRKIYEEITEDAFYIGIDPIYEELITTNTVEKAEIQDTKYKYYENIFSIEAE